MAGQRVGGRRRPARVPPGCTGAVSTEGASCTTRRRVAARGGGEGAGGAPRRPRRPVRESGRCAAARRRAPDGGASASSAACAARALLELADLRRRSASCASMRGRAGRRERARRVLVATHVRRASGRSPSWSMCVARVPELDLVDRRRERAARRGRSRRRRAGSPGGTRPRGASRACVCAECSVRCARARPRGARRARRAVDRRATLRGLHRPRDARARDRGVVRVELVEHLPLVRGQLRGLGLAALAPFVLMTQVAATTRAATPASRARLSRACGGTAER